MSTDYTITSLSEELVLIRWHRSPGAKVEDDYLHELKRLLDAASKPQFFLSDLRRGRIIGMRSIKQLSEFTSHKNWAGSTAFSKDPISKMLVGNFRAFSSNSESRNEMHNTPEEAIAFLESLKPGLTSNINWEEAIS